MQITSNDTAIDKKISGNFSFSSFCCSNMYVGCALKSKFFKIKQKKEEKVEVLMREITLLMSIWWK